MTNLSTHVQSGRWAVKLLLLALLSVGASTAARGQDTYYVGPDGDDANTGASADSPLATFDAAIEQLRPGDTLVLLDGTYPATNDDERFLTDCDANAKNGTEDARITVRAENERRAWIKGDGSVAPFRVRNCSYWDVNGLRLSSADYEGGDNSIFSVANADHIRARRLLLHHANRYENSSGVNINRSHHVLIEETEMYFFHRHAISSYKSDHITFRRDFVHARNATDLDDEDAWGSHACCRKGGDEGYTFYFTSNSVLENSISVQSEQLSIISGVETVLGNPGGQNNKMLGAISYEDFRPGFLQSRKFNDPDRPYTGPAKNILFKDFLVVGGQQIDRGAPFNARVAQDFTLDGATWYFSRQTPINADPATRTLGDRYFLGCDREEVGGCDYDVSNVLLFDNTAADWVYAPERDRLDFLMEYSNSWPDTLGSEDVTDDEGQFQNAMRKKPTKMGLSEGQCIAFVPEGSNMSGAGKNGTDIGANLLYRYEDGKLTDEPLWDPETGEFPHGAVIEGSPNDPDEYKITPASINELLNVNANGCRLPYATGSKVGEAQFE